MPNWLHNSLVLTALLFALGCAGLPGRALALDVAYTRTSDMFTDRTISVGDGGSVSAARLRPFVSGTRNGFSYRYNLLAGFTDKLTLALAYNEHGAPSVEPAQRWALVLVTRFGDQGVELDLLAPEFGSEPGAIILSAQRFLATPVTEDGKDLLQTNPDQEGARWLFDPSEKNRPIRQSGSEELKLDWQDDGRIARVSGYSMSLRFYYEGGNLTSMDLTGPAKVRWTFRYQSEPAARQLVSLTRTVAGAASDTLEFEYAQGSAIAGQARSRSMWREVRNDPRFFLPRQANVRSAPGLRLSDVNSDGFPDVVLADARNTRQSAFGGREGWKFGAPYKTPVDVVNGSVPLGAQYLNLAKKYKDKRLGTQRFQALVVGGYRSDPRDPTRLAFDNRVCFPPVFNGRLQAKAADPSAWDCDRHAGLRLPVPLQFSGTDEWPRHIPGMHAVERIGNQGARFVSFRLPQPNQTLMYIGLRYRDAATGRPIATGPGEAAFRDTKNCKEHRRLTFEALGLRRKVIEDVCQAFWFASELAWAEASAGKYDCESCFWQRIDMTGDDPNGQFILPWPGTPAYLHHYVNFRNVSFPNLAREKIHRGIKGVALVMGRGNSVAGIPDARELYALERVNRRYVWRELPRASKFYPPAPFFQRFDGRFLDIDGDGFDDAVVASGSRSEVYLNRLGEAVDDWVEAPGYRIPRRCGFDTGACQFVDLDNDKDLDLLMETGRRVFINLTAERAGIADGAMTVFTDELGQRRLVKDVLAK